MDQELLKILACPACRGALELLPLDGGEAAAPGLARPDETAPKAEKAAGNAAGALPGAVEAGLFCTACSVVYPVSGGIPVMLKEEAIARGLWDMGQRQKNKPGRK